MPARGSTSTARGRWWGCPRRPAGILTAGPLVAAVLVMPPGGPARAETLQEALLRAYQSNPTLNAQRANVLATKENLPRVQAGFRPKINATGDVGYYSEWNKHPDDGPSGSVTLPRGADVNVNQNLFNGFRTTNSILQAHSQISGAKAAVLNIEQETLLAAVRAYLDVLTDSAVLNRVRRSISSLDEELRQTRERHKFGDSTKTDIAQIESRLAGARVQAGLAEANLETSVAAYKQVVGAEPQQLKPARSVDRLVPPNLQDTVKTALRDHPAIHAASYAIGTARLEVDIVRGERLPSMDLTGLLSRRYDVSVRGDERLSGSIVGRISIPLYDGGEVAARTMQAHHIAGQRRLEAEAVQNQVRAAATSGWAQFQAARERVANARLQLKAAETALAGIREQWGLGDRTMRDVLDAEQELLTAEVNLIVAERDRVVASYAIARVVGRLTLASLEGIPLTAARDSVFEIRSTTVARRPVVKRADRPCGKSCTTLADGWQLRMTRQ